MENYNEAPHVFVPLAEPVEAMRFGWDYRDQARMAAWVAEQGGTVLYRDSRFMRVKFPGRRDASVREGQFLAIGLRSREPFIMERYEFLAMYGAPTAASTDLTPS